VEAAVTEPAFLCKWECVFFLSAFATWAVVEVVAAALGDVVATEADGVALCAAILCFVCAFTKLKEPAIIIAVMTNFFMFYNVLKMKHKINSLPL
jgi:hypothetical protein